LVAHEYRISPQLENRIEQLIGEKIQSYRKIQGGYTPALRLVCRTQSTGVFVKVGATPSTAEFLEREIFVYDRIQGDFMPHFVAADPSDVEPILVIEDLSAGFWPPPWDTKRIDLVLAQIEAMHGAKAKLEPYEEAHCASILCGTGWQAVAENPDAFLSLGMVDSGWLDQALPLLLSFEKACMTEGHSLCHWDLRSDNMCFAKDRVLFVDWNHACLSNPKLDLGFWLPSLAYEGGPAPEEILPDAPEIAAWVSGFFAARAGLLTISDAPYVRQVQRQQLDTALPWAARALGLPPLS